ncbi:hypothetical protein [Pseudohongiella acticola]|jgi:hypothetical protein|uniref:hypothetical protein n=1 Tax=Pseudohongiella acticola TaxID=1524254 RepID=UPI0030ED66AF
MCFRTICVKASTHTSIRPLPTLSLAIALCWAPSIMAAESNDPGQGWASNLSPMQTIAEPQDLRELADLTDLKESIETLEGSGDTWHPDIAESTLSLARHVQENGDHVEAIALLERAVHVSRVNHGLFSLQQVNAIEMQIESHLALDQWSEADELQQYLFYVHSRARAVDDPALIPALETFAQWNIDAFWRRVGDFPASRLVDAFHLYSVALTIVDQDEALRKQSREAMLERLAYLAWLMARSGAQDRQQSQFSIVRLVDDNWVNEVTDRRYRRHNNPFLQGEYALEQILQMRAARLARVEAAGIVGEERDQALAAHTNAILDLADWYLLFERRNASFDVYESAWLNMQNEDEALKQQVFDRIVLLPRFEPTRQPTRGPVRKRDIQVADATVDEAGPDEREPASQPEDAGSSEPKQAVDMTTSSNMPYVVMEFDINQYGRAVNVDIVESWPEDDVSMQRHQIGALRDSRMRPIIREGEAARVDGLVYRFPYYRELEEN